MPKISALPPLATPASDDEMPIVDDSTATTKKFTIADLKAIFSPVGTIAEYAGTTEPTGWLFCYGQAISRTTYADLFAVLSTTYGVGDGSTTFNLPDLRGRVIAGQDDMGGTSANRLTGASGGVNGDNLGAAGGSETHTLSSAEMPVHTHGPGNAYNDSQNVGTGGASRNVVSLTAAAGNQNLSLANAGSGSAHNNVQPTFILNMMIRY